MAGDARIGTLVISATYSRLHTGTPTFAIPVGGALAESPKVEEATVAVVPAVTADLFARRSSRTPAVAIHRECARGSVPEPRPRGGRLREPYSHYVYGEAERPPERNW